MATKNEAKVMFVVGTIVHVWETKGVRDLKGGPSSSERTGGDYPDIEPAEDLKVVQKLGSTAAIVEREDGSKIKMHINHINSESSYYALRGARGDALRGEKAKEAVSPADKVKAALALKAKADKELAEAKALLAEMEAENQELDSLLEADRKEAEALFDGIDEAVEMAVNS